MDDRSRPNRAGVRRADSASLTLIATLLVLVIAPAAVASALPMASGSACAVAVMHAVRGPICSAPARALPGDRAPRVLGERAPRTPRTWLLDAGRAGAVDGHAAVLAPRPPPIA